MLVKAAAKRRARLARLFGLFGPYTKNTTVRSLPPGLKRLGTNLAMLVKEGEGLGTNPDHIWIRHGERL